MTARDCLVEALAADSTYQRPVNSFVDAFRRADAAERQRMIAEPLDSSGPLEGLLAGVVSALCREANLDPPLWVGRTASPEPFFALPAGSFEMRLRLMIESPPPFRIRNVFVPENYLTRA